MERRNTGRIEGLLHQTLTALSNHEGQAQKLLAKQLVICPSCNRRCPGILNCDIEEPKQSNESPENGNDVGLKIFAPASSGLQKLKHLPSECR